jgi:sn-glycerol 3-phosphate transport system ATP-binding protein
MNLFQLPQLAKSGVGGLPANAGVVGVRPEDLTISTGNGDASGLALNLTVDAVEQIGAETFVYGSGADTGEVMVRVPGDEAPALGTAIRATAPRAKLHVFTADGRTRIEG